MRPAYLAALLGILLVAGVPYLAPQAAFAQDFDDEFDDEFDEPPARPAPPARGGGDEFDDSFDDDFGDGAGGDVDDDLADADNEFGDGGDDFGDEDAPEEDGAPEDEDIRDRRFRSQNSWYGPVGGLRVADAGSGAVESFRVQLATEFFSSNGFIARADHASHIGGSLSLSWTVHEMVELYGSIQSYANSNESGDPSLLQVLGDTRLGLKLFKRLSDVLTVGGDLQLALLNTVGDIGLVFKSTSLGMRANLSADLRGLSSPVPFITRFGLQYYFDNSRRLVSSVERARYENLEDPMPDRSDEYRHLVTTSERFGLQINRTDFLNIGLGFEAPLRAGEDFYVHPLLEWTWGIPVNRQGYNCLLRPEDPADDGCLDKEGVAAFPMNMTLGLRVLPPVKGLALLLAADIGLTGTNDFVRELAPNMPYNIVFAASYAYDTRPPPIPEPVVREVERTVEVQIPPPLQGRVRGYVVEQGVNTPVSGAVVAFPGRDLTSLVTGDDGRFTTYLLDPGEVRVDISHDEYNAGACATTIPDQRPEEGELIVEVLCELVAKPRVGSIDGRVNGDDGTAVIGAQVTVQTPDGPRSATTNASGRFQVGDLPPGSYQVRVEASGYLIKVQSVDVVVREVADAGITLVTQPRRPDVRIRARSIFIRREIQFVTDSAELEGESDALLTEIADVIIRNPQLTKIEIEGHTDNRGPRARNVELSQQRAEAVLRWLVAHGVDASRLEARGYGPDRPLVPNITPANRRRNRRVAFTITEQSAAE